MTLHWGGSSSPQRSPCLVSCCKREEGWAQRNYSVACRPRQRHYFHFPWTSPSGGGASCINGWTTHHQSVSSWLRRKRGGPSCPSFPKWFTAYRYTNIHVLKMRWASHFNILLSIQLILYMFYCAFWWSISNYGIHSLFDIIFRYLD